MPNRLTSREAKMLEALNRAHPIVADGVGDSETLNMVKDAIAACEPKVNPPPTREELIQALRIARECVGLRDDNWEYIAEKMALVDPIIAKCEPKPEPKPRRWVVEFCDAPQTHMMPTEHDNCSVKVIREVKPINRLRVHQILAREYGTLMHTGSAEAFDTIIREFGIEVEE